MTAKVLRGSFGAIQGQSIQAKETRPRQEELAGKANQGKALKETRPRQEELAGKATQGTALKETRPWQEELAGQATQGISRNLPRHASRPGKAR